MITVHLVEGLVGAGRKVAVEVMSAVPRVGELVEIGTGRVFEVRRVRWLVDTPEKHDRVVLEVQGICPGCHMPVWDGKVRCDNCAFADEAAELEA